MKSSISLVRCAFSSLRFQFAALSVRKSGDLLVVGLRPNCSARRVGVLE